MKWILSSFIIISSLFLAQPTLALDPNGLVEMSDEELNRKMGLCQVDTNVTSDAPAASTSSGAASSGAISR